MASVTVTETLEVNQIEVTTDNPVTSVTVADATSIDSVAVVESGSDITVQISPNAAGVSSINGLTGVVQVQEAITAQGNITVGQALNAQNFTQGSIENTGSFSSYAQNPVFHGYNITLGGEESGNNLQGITFAGSPSGNAWLGYDESADKIVQSRDGTNYYAIPINTGELAEGTNLYYTDARADARVNAAIANINYPVDSVNGQTNTVVLDTDDISEGSTNLYYTDARADARVQAGIAAIDYPVDSVNGKTNTVVLSTTDIGEGTNLYYTDARFDSRLASKTTTNLAEGTNLYYTTARANADFDTRLATKTTDNLNEGTTNQYFTNARARAAIQVNDLGGDGSLAYNSNTGVISYTGPSASEVRAHFTGGTGVTITDGSIAIGQAVGTTSNVTFNDGVFNGNLTVNGTTTYVNTTDLNITDKTITIAYGQTGTPTQNAGIVVDRGDLTDSELRWNESTDRWEQVRAGTVTVIPVNTTELSEGTNLYYTTARANSDFDTRLATKSTTDLAEGTNLYYTTARANSDFDTRLATKSTTDLAEGTNLYYTDARARAALSGGTGVTYDANTGVISIGQSVATTADVTFDTVKANYSIATGGASLSGDAANTFASFSATGTVSGSTSLIGFKAENAIAGYGAGILVQDHGQNRSGGTATTSGNPTISFESTRGTNSTPTASSTNDTLGVISFSGHDGTRGLGTSVNGGSVQLLALAASAYTNDGTYTTNAGANFILRTQPTNLRLTSASRQQVLLSNYTLVTGAPPTQNILWNSTSMATQYDTAGTSINGHGKQVHQFFHPQFQIYGVPSQSTGNVDNGNLVGTNQITFYSSRQSGWTGRRDAVQSGDTLAQINVFGQTGTDATGNGSQTGILDWTAAENFTTGVRGSRFRIATGDIGANTLTDRLLMDSANTNFSTTKTTFQHSAAAAVKGGEISMKAGILNGSSDYDKTTEMSVTAFTTDGTRNATYETKTLRWNGTNYSATQNGDLLGRFTFLGNYSTTNTPASANAAGYMTVTAAENFTSGASGATISLNVNKIGSNDTMVAASLNSNSAIFKSKDFYFQNPDSTVNQFIATPGNPTGAQFIDRIAQLRVFTASTVAGEASTVTFQSANYNAGTQQYTATQSGDVLGNFFFNGNYNTGSNTQVNGPAVSFGAKASENWTSTANGGKFYVETITPGTTSSAERMVVDHTGITTPGRLFYDKVYGEFSYTGGNITIAAQNTVYAFPLDTTAMSSDISISNTSRINIAKAGQFKIIMSLQTIMTTNSVGSFKFWLRRNGTDVANSATEVDLLKDQKAVVAMDWMVDASANDYYEIVYASAHSNYANIAFPTIAATTTPYVAPLAPAIIVNVIPVGA